MSVKTDANGLQEKRNKLAGDIQSMAKEFRAAGNKWESDEKRAKFSEINTEYDSVVKELELENAAREVEERSSFVAEQSKRSYIDRIPGQDDVSNRGSLKRRKEMAENAEDFEEKRNLLLGAWCRSQADLRLSRAQVEACRELRFNPNRKTLDLRLPDTRGFAAVQAAFRSGHPSGAESRALSALKGSTGGALVNAPNSLLGPFETQRLAFGGILQAAQVIRTAVGDEMSWPMANDTGNSGRILGEARSVSSVDPSFVARKWGAHTFTSDEILVPYALMQDAAFDLAGAIGGMLGERIGRIQSTKYTTGTGSGEPYGIVTASTLGKTAASATAITYSEIIQLKHSVNSAYRAGARFAMSDGVLLYCKLLLDSTGRPLWSSGMAAGQPDTIDGDPVLVIHDMASSVVASAKTILYGDLSRYKVREVGSIRLYRLEERFRTEDQDGFMAFLRGDGNLLTAGSPVKYLQQAAS
jgi:HK97 family phage major capsid protein